MLEATPEFDLFNFPPQKKKKSCTRSIVKISVLEIAWWLIMFLPNMIKNYVTISQKTIK